MSIKPTGLRVRFFLPAAILLLLISTFGAIQAQDTAAFDPALALRLQSTLDSGRARRGTIGISVAIISPQKGRWRATSGISEPDDPIRPDMLLGRGSITKTFTAATILQMVDEGKLSLADRVSKWLPSLPNVDSAITIRQLLAHTSGIYNYTTHDGFWAYTSQDLDRYIAPEELLQFIGPRRFAPGTNWSYSNTNYLLLGMIIETIGGNDYRTEIRSRFIEPLGLTSVEMGSEESLPGPEAHNWADLTGDGIVDDATGWPRRAIYSGAWAAGGLYATAGDLARWARALYGGELLSPAMRTQMTTFRNIGGGSGYGLGAMRQSVAGRTMWGHNGAIVAYYSTMLYNPVDSTSFVALINQDGPDAEEILAEVVAEYYRVSSVRDHKAGVAVAASHPNPFTTSITIDYRLERSDEIAVKIYTVTGELVRTLERGDRASGSYATTWDGNDDAGVPVAAGAYICRIEGMIGSTSSMLVKMGR